MSRYTERAENTARMLDVNYQTSLLPQSAAVAQVGWQGLLSISELVPAYTVKHGEITPRAVMALMGKNEGNPSSIVSCLKAARENETNVYYHYSEFAKRARDEGYRGIAYLFLAFAASERGHASNFGRVLTRLGEELVPLPKPAVSLASTRDNLILAANGEMASIDGFYPGLLAKISGEKHADAIDAVQFAWASEKQHRDKIKQIQRWTPSFFETVARTIDDKTDRYFICQLCGSTVNKVPEGACPVCKNPPAQYRLIEPTA